MSAATLTAADAELATDSARSIVVTLTGDSLVASGIAPRGEAIVFGRTIEERRGAPRLDGGPLRVSDDDGDGVISIPIETRAHRGVWVVIDLESGRYGSVARRASSQVTLQPRRVLKDLDGDFEVSRALVQVLFVRPKSGAWTALIREGSPLDADGQPDAWLRVRLDSLQSVGAGEAVPSKAKKHDVVVVIDPLTLEILASEAQ